MTSMAKSIPDASPTLDMLMCQSSWFIRFAPATTMVPLPTLQTVRTVGSTEVGVVFRTTFKFRVLTSTELSPAWRHVPADQDARMSDVRARWVSPSSANDSCCHGDPVTTSASPLHEDPLIQN